MKPFINRIGGVSNALALICEQFCSKRPIDFESYSRPFICIPYRI